MCDYHARPISRKYHRDPSTRIAPRGNENGGKTCTIDHPGRRKRVPSRTSILRISFFTPFESLPRYKRRTISRTVHNILRARECIREKRKGIRRRDEVEISDDALLSFFFFFVRRNRYDGDAGIVQFYKRCPPTRLSRAA